MAYIGEPNFSRRKGAQGPERLERILDAKTRTIGLDRGALAAQVAEKSMRYSRMKELDLESDKLACRVDAQVSIMEQERRAIQAQLIKENSHYWSTSQAFHTRKEYDLNRPKMLQTEPPIRMGEYDPRLSLSSIQIFSGEDNKAGERKKMQMVQSRAWFDQQVLEKLEREAEEAEETKNYRALAIAQADYSLQADAGSGEGRRMVQIRNMKDNKDLSVIQRAQKQQLLDEEARANQLDKFNTFNSVFLNEHPTLARTTGSKRIRKDAYKGMLPSEKQAVHDFQAAQRDELQYKREQEKKEDNSFSRYSMDMAREFGRRQGQIETLRAEQRKSVQETLKRQQSEKAEKEVTHKLTMVHSIAPEFYEQFGRSHR